VALAAVSGQSASQIASWFGVHPTQVAVGRKELAERAAVLFADGRCKETSEASEHELLEQLGRLQMVLSWLKKKLPRSRSEYRQWIDPEHRELPPFSPSSRSRQAVNSASSACTARLTCVLVTSRPHSASITAVTLGVVTPCTYISAIANFSARLLRWPFSSELG
jgi:transposase-like protein